MWTFVYKLMHNYTLCFCRKWKRSGLPILYWSQYSSYRSCLQVHLSHHIGMRLVHILPSQPSYLHGKLSIWQSISDQRISYSTSEFTELPHHNFGIKNSKLPSIYWCVWHSADDDINYAQKVTSPPLAEVIIFKILIIS